MHEIAAFLSLAWTSCAAMSFSFALQAQEAASDTHGQTSEPSPLGAFVTDELMAGSFLRQLLQPFLEEVLLTQDSTARHARLHAEASRLRTFLQQAFGWTFGLQELRGDEGGQAFGDQDDQETDDEAPVIVDLGEPFAL